MRTRTALAGLAVATVTAGSMALFATGAQAQPPVQLCAATSLPEVDRLLDDLATGELTGNLAGLVALTVPKDADSVVLKSDVTLSQVRTALVCAVAPSGTPTPTPTPTVTPAPTPDLDPPFESCAEAREAGVNTPILADEEAYSLDLDADADGIACEVDEDRLPPVRDTDDEDDDSAFPIGSVDTGWTR